MSATRAFTFNVTLRRRDSGLPGTVGETMLVVADCSVGLAVFITLTGMRATRKFPCNSGTVLSGPCRSHQLN